jgi:hypothetical protein
MVNANSVKNLTAFPYAWKGYDMRTALLWHELPRLDKRLSTRKLTTTPANVNIYKRIGDKDATIGRNFFYRKPKTEN